MKISELKKEARIKLTGKWPLAIGINFLHLIITFVLTYTAENAQDLVASILLIISAIITIPLSYGLTASMLKLSRNEEVGLTDFITIGFKNFKRAFFLNLSIFIRVLIPIILFAISIVVIVLGVAFNYTTDPISLIILSLSLIWIMFISLSLALSTYILIDNESTPIKEVIKTSKTLMKGNKLKLIGLVFSFFGWLLLIGIISGVVQAYDENLGAIIASLLSLILTPYITFAEINFYEDLANVSKTEIKSEATEVVIEENSIE